MSKQNCEKKKTEFEVYTHLGLDQSRRSSSDPQTQSHSPHKSKQTESLNGVVALLLALKKNTRRIRCKEGGCERHLYKGPVYTLNLFYFSIALIYFVQI